MYSTVHQGTTAYFSPHTQSRTEPLDATEFIISLRHVLGPQPSQDVPPVNCPSPADVISLDDAVFYVCMYVYIYIYI